jgi:multisubunit Na+/H+ antiporter MnhG subunit
MNCLGVSGNALYMWAWSLTSMMLILLIVLLMVLGLHLMNEPTYNAGSDTYTKTITPTTFTQKRNSRIGFFKAKDGNG